MNKQLFVVYYHNSPLDRVDTRLFVSEPLCAHDRVQEMIRKGDIQTDQENPAIIGHQYIDGYYIQILPDSIENIVEGLMEKREELFANSGEKEFNSHIGYLEALRDILAEVSKDWREETLPRETKVRGEIRASWSSNIPHGYNEEGDRM